jgi:farnesyl-diphosphate farnesyltransferase
MANLDDLLEKTSRTFALSIPELPEPTRREVAVAYLLFRVADTFEDATLWPRSRRLRALSSFAQLLERADLGGAGGLCREWARDPPTSHAGYLELLEKLPSVLEDFRSLREPAVRVVAEHVARSSRGMAEFVGRMTEDGYLRLSGLADLRAYCYAVAGIVGEMLTELFLLERPPLVAAAGDLRPRAALFGEGLQLVNILKDAVVDGAEGRSYLPSGVERSEVFELARRDLDAAAAYIRRLQEAGAPRGVVGFTALPVRLAWAALDRVEKLGPGAKVPRLEVYRIVASLHRALDRGEPALPARPIRPAATSGTRRPRPG